MLKTLIIINILVKALSSLRISSLYLILVSIVTFSYIAAFIIWVVNIQSIGFGNEIFSSLYLSSLLPVKPGDDKPKRLTKLEQSQFYLSDDLKDVLVGLLLGDLTAEKQSLNVRLKFAQGILHADYIQYLYELFHNFCPVGPKIEISKPHWRTGEMYSSIYFRTYSLPCFKELFDLFYPDGKKIVPLNIGDLLTLRGLCFLICDDGSFCKVRSIITLCTESFTLEDVTLLANTLNAKCFCGFLA